MLFPATSTIMVCFGKDREEMGQPLVNYIKIASDKCKGQCGQTIFSYSKIESSPSEDITLYC